MAIKPEISTKTRILGGGKIRGKIFVVSRVKTIGFPRLKNKKP